MTNPAPHDAHEQPETASAPADRSETRFALVLTAVYLALAIGKVLLHVMWRDEWRWWMMARDSASAAELLTNLRYDGHPGLWFSVLFLLSRFTRDPLAMQLAHATIATAAVWVVARFAPFTRLQRALFAFGYFAFFEYSTVSRGYGAGLLLTAVTCVVFTRYGARRVLTLAALVALLANSSVYGLFIAGAFALAYVLGRHRKLPPLDIPPPARWRESLAAVILIAGVVASIALMLPGPDKYMYRGTWYGVSWPERVAATLATVWRAYVPLPRPVLSFWNTNLLDPASWTMAAAGVVLLLLVVVMLRRHPVPLTFFLAGTGVILVITCAKFAGTLRHFGHLFIILMVAYWMIRAVGPARPWVNVSFTLLLAIHAIAGIAASVIAARVPLSASREVARYLRDEGLVDLPLIGHTETSVSSVSGCLDRPIFYLSQRNFSSFNTQDARKLYPLFYDKMMQNIDRVIAEGGKGEAVLITTEPINLPAGRATLLKRFDRSIVQDERYAVYRVRARTLPTTSPAVN